MDTVQFLLIANAVIGLAVLLILLFKKNNTQVDATPVVSELTRITGDFKSDLVNQRGEIREALYDNAAQLDLRLKADGEQQTQALQAVRVEVDNKLELIRTGNEDKLEKIRRTLDEKIEITLTNSLKENSDKIQSLNDSQVKQQEELRSKIGDEIEKVREKLGTELDKLRTENEQKLEQMRATVDEKLQGTLEKRLGESFKLVSERLEQVQKGLGEMQTLASDVGGLKRVLTNVKSRGSWGEVQLSRQLEDILTQEQYLTNAKIRPTSDDLVEFAIKLPGRADDESVLLPIDSKFPQESYERLLVAQETGETAEIEKQIRELEKEIKQQAKRISDKYIEPPISTDFAIMYLPTEGLFAEVIRRPGLASELQSKFRVLVTGPTTLMSLLNSLQMGFKTLAIEKSTSEVWKILSAAKTEFQKYGQIWDKLEKQLSTAQNTVSEAGRRTRAIERNLRKVETLEIGGTSSAKLQELTEGFLDDSQLEDSQLEDSQLDEDLLLDE